MKDLYKSINIKALEEIPEEIMNIANATHEQFSAFVHAGFSRSEAFSLLIVSILNKSKGGQTMNEKNIFKETCEDVAKDLFKMYESFVKAGFDKTQAFYLTSEILKGGLKNGKNSIE